MRATITKIAQKFSLGTVIIQTVLSIFLVLGIHGAVWAQSNPSDASQNFNVKGYLTADGQTQQYFKSSNPIATLIIEIINFLVYTIGSLCFLALVIGGFILVTSHGNENSVTKGKEVITMALIGLAITLLSFFITAFVQSIFYEVPGK